jgi:hypothetical protein
MEDCLSKIPFNLLFFFVKILNRNILSNFDIHRLITGRININGFEKITNLFFCKFFMLSDVIIDFLSFKIEMSESESIIFSLA